LSISRNTPRVCLLPRKADKADFCRGLLPGPISRLCRRTEADNLSQSIHSIILCMITRRRTSLSTKAIAITAGPARGSMVGYTIDRTCKEPIRMARRYLLPVSNWYAPPSVVALFVNQPAEYLALSIHSIIVSSTWPSSRRSYGTCSFRAHQWPNKTG